MAVKANLLGTEAMVRERLRVYRACGLTTLRVDPAGATLDARLATLGRLMELVRASKLALRVQELDGLLVDLHVLTVGDGRGLGRAHEMAPAPRQARGVE